MVNKAYSKSGGSCRVTFELPSDVNAETAYLCGDFNEWDPRAHPMERRKDGSFRLTVPLKPGKMYRYRFLLDGERWENGWEAESYEANPFATEDSRVQV